MFRWYVERHGGLEITPGYYELAPSDHMGNVLGRLRTPPEQTYTKVTFPEGFTVAQIAARLDRDMATMTAADFLAAAADPAVVASLRPPGVTSLEGLLFPDTYQVSNGESEAQVIARMIAQMERVANQEDIVTKGERQGQSPYGILIIASLIEREAKTDEDRAKIARVIYNRLAIGMPLQHRRQRALRHGPGRSRSDPDVTPFTQQREMPGPWNTYLNQGLPPTPIANPGRASIQAALNPAPNPSVGDPLCAGLPEGVACQYLYYVLANEEGSHAFAVTPEQHEANVQRRRGRPAGLTRRMRVAAVIGSPVQHSLSPALHNAAFRAAGLDWVYVAFEVAPGSAAARAGGDAHARARRAVGDDAAQGGRRRGRRRAGAGGGGAAVGEHGGLVGRTARRPQHRRRRVRRLARRVGRRRRRRSRRRGRRRRRSPQRRRRPRPGAAPATSPSSTARRASGRGRRAGPGGAGRLAGRHRRAPTSSSTPRRSAWAPTSCRSTRRCCAPGQVVADLVYHPLRHGAAARPPRPAGCRPSTASACSSTRPCCSRSCGPARPRPGRDPRRRRGRARPPRLTRVFAAIGVSAAGTPGRKHSVAATLGSRSGAFGAASNVAAMLRYLTAGESHGQALVVIVEGLPAGLAVTVEDIQAELARRRLGYGRGPRQRFEVDELTLVGGVRHGRTLGSPVAIEIKNTEWFRSDKWHAEMSPAPGATEAPLTQVRPGHADLAGMQKYGFTDARDVLERASARETAARVAAGAARQAAARRARRRRAVARRADGPGAVHRAAPDVRRTSPPSTSRRCAASTPPPPRR